MMEASEELNTWIDTSEDMGGFVVSDWAKYTSAQNTKRDNIHLSMTIAIHSPQRKVCARFVSACINQDKIGFSKKLCILLQNRFCNKKP